MIGSNAFVVNNINNNFHRHHIEIKQQQRKSSIPSCFSSSPLAFYRHHSLSTLSLSAIDSEESSTSPSSSIPSTDNATANASKSTVADFAAGTSNRSRREDQKRYDAELEEAFAQQTRERNPLLGVKSIGVDYGLVRTGVAVTIGYNPEALDVIITDHPLLKDYEVEEQGLSESEVEEEEERRLEIQRSKVAEKVVELARRETVDRIVVGLPLHKNGTEAPQTALTRKFARDHLAILALRTLGPGVSVYMCDERYTSKEAAARIRSQTSQNGKNGNGDLYGLLDAESAKIILEQYYDDDIQRHNTRHLNSDDDNDGDTNKINHSYNGELVTIQDVDLIEELTSEYKEKRRREREQLAGERNDREERTKWRKLALEQDRIRAEEQRKEDAANGIITATKKKKKKKRKRK